MRGFRLYPPGNVALDNGTSLGPGTNGDGDDGGLCKSTLAGDLVATESVSAELGLAVIVPPTPQKRSFSLRSPNLCTNGPTDESGSGLGCPNSKQ